MKKILLLSIALILAASISAPAIAGRRLVTYPKKAGADLPLWYGMESNCDDDCADYCKYCCCTPAHMLSNSVKFISQDCSACKDAICEHSVCSQESFTDTAKALATVVLYGAVGTIVCPILFVSRHAEAACHERIEEHNARVRAATSFQVWEEYDSAATPFNVKYDSSDSDASDNDKPTLHVSSKKNKRNHAPTAIVTVTATGAAAEEPVDDNDSSGTIETAAHERANKKAQKATHNYLLRSRTAVSKLIME